MTLPPEIYYFTFSFIGFYLAYLYGRHTSQFLWKEYIAMLAPPILGLIGLAFVLGARPIYIFLISSVIGPSLEYIVGFLYHRTMGAHLWVYERYSLPGRYTSYLAAPMWGFGLVMFWLILKNL